MLGLLVSLVLTSAPPAIPSASVTCPEGPASCDVVWVAQAGGPEAARQEDTEDGPRYATPAEIDCPAPPGGRAGGPSDLGSGECDGTPLDLWYRASRLSDGPQRSDGSLAPARRTREVRAATSCDVPQQPAAIAAGQGQPVALFALLPTQIQLLQRLVFRVGTETPLTRALAPLDRPPRA
jgi:hypothetical protein